MAGLRISEGCIFSLAYVCPRNGINHLLLMRLNAWCYIVEQCDGLQNLKTIKVRWSYCSRAGNTCRTLGQDSRLLLIPSEYELLSISPQELECVCQINSFKQVCSRRLSSSRDAMSDTAAITELPFWVDSVGSCHDSPHFSRSRLHESIWGSPHAWYCHLQFRNYSWLWVGRSSSGFHLAFPIAYHDGFSPRAKKLAWKLSVAVWLGTWGSGKWPE